MSENTQKPAALTDESHMPFGKYGPGRGDHRQLKAVPASYLLWLWDERLRNEQDTPLGQYVKSAYKVLVSDSDYDPKFDRDGKKKGR